MKTTRKRLIKVMTMVITLAMVFAVFFCAPFTVGAADGFLYSYISDDYVEITGYQGTAKNITVPAEYGNCAVVGIDEGAFAGNTNLESVKISEGIVYIKSAAFSDCTNLKSISMPESMVAIAPEVFWGTAHYNNNSNWQDGVYYVGKFAIEMRNNVSKVSLKHGTLGIANAMAFSCPNLTAFTIPDSVKYIGSLAVFDCTKMKGITIPYGAELIGSYAFGYKMTDEYTIEKMSDFKVTGARGTLAEDYADHYDFPFVNSTTAKSMSINRTSLTLGVGEEYTLIKKVLPSSAANCTWTSSNSSVASVNSNGTVTAKKAGAATITVKTASGMSKSCKVTVKSAPSSIKVSTTNLTLGVGEGFIISESTNAGSYAWKFGWSSSNSSVASVVKTSGNKAKITAKSAGTATITVKTYNGKTATCKVTVKSAPTSVTLSEESVGLGKGETFIIAQNSNSGSYAKNFTWSSSNTSVVTVEKTSGNKAKITAKGNGTATITIKTYNGKTDTCKVTVKNSPSSVSLSKTSLTLGTGETYVISENTNSGSYANAANLKWSSTDTNVATVTKDSKNKAVITAKGNGTATIKITLYNGKTATCKVTVKNAPSSVKLSTSNLTLNVGEEYTISESTDSGSYANADNLKWSSSDTSVVTVKKATGNKAVITATGTGTATVTLTLYNGKTASCQMTVGVPTSTDDPETSLPEDSNADD